MLKIGMKFRDLGQITLIPYLENYLVYISGKSNFKKIYMLLFFSINHSVCECIGIS